MNYQKIFQELARNQAVFQNLLSDQSKEAYLWRPNPEHWCLLEIVCHLYDEEREDFRVRLKTVLETPGIYPPPIDPEGWVDERDYISRNYDIMVHKFLDARSASLQWLHSLENPQWDNFHEHSVFGEASGNHYLSNWLAHDYLHIRQITRLKYNYVKFLTGRDISYAGKW